MSTGNREKGKVPWLAYWLGLATGVIVTALGFVAVGTYLRANSMLRLDRASGNLIEHLREIIPEEEQYFLVHEGVAVAIISATRDDVKAFVTWTPDRRRQVSIRSKDGVFPGAASVDESPTGRIHPPRTTIVDSNLDGLPDKRFDWEANEMSKRAHIEWITDMRTATEPDAGDRDNEKP